MDLSLNETQQLIRDSIREYLEKEVPFSRVRQVEHTGGIDADLWQGLASFGWLGLPFPEDLGGQGGELTDAGVFIEELTRRAVLIPIACSPSPPPSRSSASARPHLPLTS